MTRLTTGLLIGLVLGLAAPAAAQRLGPIPDPTASGRQWMREQQEQFDRSSQRLHDLQQLQELQQIRQEIQRQGLELELQRQQETWRSIGDTERQESRRWDYRRRFLNDD